VKRAVVYVRVSSQDQVHNLSLDTQEKHCRDLCARQGWQVARVFREEGESAKTADRTELRVLLSHIAEARPRVDFVVMYDTKRFMRNWVEYAILKDSLKKLGAELRYVALEVDDSTPQGVLLEGFNALLAHVDNLERSKRTRDGMREALERGRWPWLAPLGYRNRVSEDGRKKWIEPDPATAPLIRWAFEQAATGLKSKDELRAELAGRGLEVKRETFYRILRNRIYLGRVAAPQWGIDLPGEHEPLVDWPTFRAAQRAITQRRAYVTGPTSEFPFRQVVRCCGCGRGLAGYFARGRRGNRYPFYRCQGCKVNASAARVETDFARLLDRMAVPPRALDLLERIVRDVVNQRQARQSEIAEAANRRLAMERTKRERLFEAFAYKDAIDEREYHARRAVLDERIATLEHEASASASPIVNFEPVLAASRQLLQLPLMEWDRVKPHSRPALLRGLFPRGLGWEPAGTFRTPDKSLLRLPLPAVSRPDVAGGTPDSADFESIGEWFQELEAVLPLLGEQRA